MALWLLTCLVFVTGVAVLRNYFELVDNSGDSSAYMAVASAIRHWNFHGLVVKHFWGLPYAMAALSLLTGVSDRTALLLIFIHVFWKRSSARYRSLTSRTRKPKTGFR